jgi:hypothetical protein
MMVWKLLLNNMLKLTLVWNPVNIIETCNIRMLKKLLTAVNLEAAEAANQTPNALPATRPPPIPDYE